jgi:hypothetical protein
MTADPLRHHAGTAASSRVGSARGRCLRGLAAALILMASCGKEAAGPTGPIPVATIQVSPDSTSVEVLQNATFTATMLDQGGFRLFDRVVTWTSSDPVRAPVNGGTVTTNAVGRFTITATSEGKSAAAVLNVVGPPPNDYAVAGVHLTQGVQTEDGSIPFVLSGNALVANILVTAATRTERNVQVVLRLLDAAGTVVRSDTVRTSGSLADDPTYLRPSAQIMVPSSALAAGLRWQVEVDPRRIASDQNVANNVFPSTGPRALATVAVPALRIRFVPIVLSGHGGLTATIGSTQFADYLRTLQSVHPLGTVTASIGTAVTTSASFGMPPSGGAFPFWSRVLQDLDLARIADASDPQAHWYGLVLPPQGFNFTQFGGIAYIPFSGQSTGAGTRSGAGVQLGWFNDPAGTRELVGHELGHNFGREHAPCGNAPDPDPRYPTPDGRIGILAYDVHGWATGRATSAVTLDPSLGDVMSYCTPVWASPYTYRGVLSFRGATGAAAPSLTEARTRVLVVRGSFGDDGAVLQPVIALQGFPTRPEREGPNTLIGRDADGRELFRYGFEPARLDHSANLRPFAFAIPASEELEARLATIEVAGTGRARARADPAYGARCAELGCTDRGIGHDADRALPRSGAGHRGPRRGDRIRPGLRAGKVDVGRTRGRRRGRRRLQRRDPQRDDSSAGALNGWPAAEDQLVALP